MDDLPIERTANGRTAVETLRRGTASCSPKEKTRPQKNSPREVRPLPPEGFTPLYCAKFVLKICTMDRILQNQWNV